MAIGLDDILDYLNTEKVRCTYGAVAGLLGIMPISVGSRLGERRREASWIVNGETGRPTGYTPEQIHRDLDMSLGKPITDPQELERLVDEHRRRRGRTGTS